MSGEKEIYININLRNKKVLMALGILAVCLVSLGVYAALQFQRTLSTSVTIQSSYDLSVTYLNGTEAYFLSFDGITQGGNGPSEALTIKYIGNNAGGVDVNWIAVGVPYDTSLTAKEDSTGSMLSWVVLNQMVHLNIGESFNAQWFFQDLGALAGSYSWTIAIQSNS